MNMEKIRAVIFDLDGTLLDTLDDLAAAVNHALSEHALPVRSKKEVRSFLGNGIRNLMLQATGNRCEGEAAFEAVFKSFRSYYMAHCLDYTRPYPGIMALLAELKLRGIKTAIVSNKLDAAVQELNGHFFTDYVAVAVGESATVRRKPCPDSVNSALKQLGCEADEAIYVGDSEVDLATARNAGTRCALVLWGFRDEPYLREIGGDCFLHEANDLLALL